MAIGALSDVSGLAGSFGTGGLSFGAGTSATSALQAGLGTATKAGGSTAAKGLGSLIPGVGTMFAAASFGLDLFNMFRPDPNVYQNAYNESFNRFMAQYQLEQRNKQRIEMYGQQLAMVKSQIENNASAAFESWTSEQLRLNEVYDKAALISQQMLKQLVETQGRSAAREVYGKSARRGALIKTLGAYGRSRATLAKQLTSEVTATERRLAKTQSSLKIANDRALAQVANLPTMEFMPDQPYTDYTKGSPLQTGLKIAQAGIGAGMAGWALTPKGDTFFGFTKGGSPSAA